MIDPRLLNHINRGRCFALIGSGPSSELGYPSWRQLAEATYHHLSNTGLASDQPTYQRYLQGAQYPELFRQAELDMRSRTDLLSLLKRLLVPTKTQGFLYDLLVKWPFACYLTTNYDDELPKRLRQTGTYYSTLRNRLEDLRVIRDGASHYVVKLHSDLNHPDEVILTSLDYQRLSTAPEGSYFRDKLRQIMEMFTVVIIGHSVSDFDLQLVLKIAKETADPRNPVFLIAADFTKGQETEFLEKYNVNVCSYPNADGQHLHLRRVLSAADRYISPRAPALPEPGPTASTEESSAAAALLIFRRLKTLQFTQPSCQAEYLGPLILQSLLQPGDTGASLEELLALKPLSLITKTSPLASIAAADVLRVLADRGLIVASADRYRLTPLGRDAVDEVAALRAAESDQAYGQFITTLKQQYPHLTADDETRARSTIETTIVNVFRTRGLALASAIFAGQSVRPEDLSDIFKAVSDGAAVFPVGDLRAAFSIAVHQLLLDPSFPQKKYLESVSQGYFLYHMVGLDPGCTRIRRELFEQTLWVVDSSVVLPLLAVGCNNHTYAVDFFARLRSANAKTFITRRLLRESWEHFYWALRHVPEEAYVSPTFMEAALVKGSYKQNLFVDGFVRLGADGIVSSFKDYVRMIVPGGSTNGAFDAEIERQGFAILDIEPLVRSSFEDWGELVDLQEKIKADRESRGIFRSELQVEAEAEVLFFIRSFTAKKPDAMPVAGAFERAYFVSTSRVLDRVVDHQAVTTWTPEALYRYVLSLPGQQTNADYLQQCMLQEYFHAGVSFIDRTRYLKFFGPAINTARLSFAEQRNKYLLETEQQDAAALWDEAFEKTPDLEKPFFVSQMGWRAAEVAQRSAEAATIAGRETAERAVGLEARVKQLEGEKSKAWRKRERRRRRQAVASDRNVGDPKHLLKRLRQQKARAKKKKRKR